MDNKEFWTFSSHAHTSWNFGEFFNTKEDAEKASIEYFKLYDLDTHIFIGRAELIEIPDPDITYMLEDIDNTYLQEIDSDYDDFLFNLKEIPKEALDTLDKRVSKAFREFLEETGIKSNWYKIVEYYQFK